MNFYDLAIKCGAISSTPGLVSSVRMGYNTPPKRITDVSNINIPPNMFFEIDCTATKDTVGELAGLEFKEWGDVPTASIVEHSC